MDPQIEYKTNHPVSAKDVIEVFNSSGIIRPTNDTERIGVMFNHSNLVISAWDDNRLVGVSRALTDFAYCCYLSDLAVKKEYQNLGIGKRMVEITKEQLGNKVMLLLLARP